MGSTYVVRGDEIAIVETGTSVCVPHVLDGLHRLGVNPSDVRHILLTHVHMDHAGGTGTLLPSMPEATVYIHSRTAKYLVDPAELLVSAERALGPLFPLHGTVDPVPAERIVYADELELELGRGVMLRALQTPGHSPDHLAYYETNSRCLWSGDALGVSMAAARFEGPMTPPPAVNIAAQHETFAKLSALDIETLLFSHYGPGKLAPRDHIELQRERYEYFYNLVHEQWQAGSVDAELIVQQMTDFQNVEVQHAQLTEGWVRMSINGLLLAFERAARKSTA
jgi:glyoxylase-like metal-dependent hydrolase (beta-lactamase superfamily II)